MHDLLEKLGIEEVNAGATSGATTDPITPHGAGRNHMIPNGMNMKRARPSLISIAIAL